MIFTNIKIAKQNQGCYGNIPNEVFQEILLLLNTRSYSNRNIPSQRSYKTPKDISEEDQCHATARKFAEVNDGWTRVSGYIIKISALEADCDKVYLWAHSVVEDASGNLLELMPTFSSLEDTIFIKHPSGIQGYDLIASKN